MTLKTYTLFFFFLTATVCLMGQNTVNTETSLPYYEIPPNPETYTPGTVAARMIDGLGFRYYWATEGLNKKDLLFKPGDEARTTEETLDHILQLSKVIVNATQKSANTQSSGEPELTFQQTRKATLENLKTASDVLRSFDQSNLDEFMVVFQRGENTSEYPFWNLINGPIADAIWHVGQVVSFRRSSGNPFNPKVSVFNGKVRK